MTLTLSPAGLAVRLAALLVLTACGPVSGSGTTGATDPYAVQVGSPGEATCLATTPARNIAGAAATNRPRSGAGLPQVSPNPQLARAAAAHACDMARRGRMTHIGSTTSGPADRLRLLGYTPRITAENIAAGPFPLQRVLNEWNTSQGHLDNILLPQVRDYGIGQAIAADGRTVYWSAIYAAPR